MPKKVMWKNLAYQSNLVLTSKNLAIQIPNVPLLGGGLETFLDPIHQLDVRLARDARRGKSKNGFVRRTEEDANQFITSLIANTI
jgi:hypothetical protein